MEKCVSKFIQNHWWLRSPVTNNFYSAWFVRSSGDSGYNGVNGISYGRTSSHLSGHEHLRRVFSQPVWWRLRQLHQRCLEFLREITLSVREYNSRTRLLYWSNGWRIFWCAQYNWFLRCKFRRARTLSTTTTLGKFTLLASSTTTTLSAIPTGEI